MDDLFQIPLWMMWKHAYPKTEEEKVRHDVSDLVATMMEVERKEGAVVSHHVERSA